MLELAISKIGEALKVGVDEHFMCHFVVAFSLYVVAVWNGCVVCRFQLGILAISLHVSCVYFASLKANFHNNFLCSMSIRTIW